MDTKKIIEKIAHCSDCDNSAVKRKGGGLTCRCETNKPLDNSDCCGSKCCQKGENHE